jgi:putative aldouronate transport system substrate-binding protein
MTSGAFLISRRVFLRFGAGAIALSGVTLLGACAPNNVPPQPTQPGPPQAPASAAATTPPAATVAQPTSPPPPTVAPVAVAPTPTSGSARAAVQLPAYVPLAGIKPDLPASADGLVDAGFVNYPANPIKSVQDTPGRGGEISAVTWTTSPAPTPMESNSLWQAVNKELGVTLRISIQAQADYATIKLPTIVAGDDLPDIVYIATNAVIPQLPTFFQSKMADLTRYLSGDAVKDYPNLAALPTITWQPMVFNNAIYGIPCANSLFLWVHWVHHELLDAEGLSDPRNAEEYRQLAVHFTRPDQNLWGLGAENNIGMGMTNGWLTGIFGAPNLWALDDQSGKLTYTAETEQYRAAVGYARSLWAAGAYHPNALQYNLVSARNDMAARRFAFRMDGFGVASNLMWAQDKRRDPPGDARVVPPFPAVDGGKPTFWTTPGNLGYSVIKKAPPERIKEILRVLNWLAAPLGTQEYLLKTYGLKSEHWTPDDNGNPILTDRGKADATVPFHYLTRAPTTMYWPDTPEKTPGMHAVQEAYHPYLSLNPTNAYYSETNSSKLPAMTNDLVQVINDVVVGRQPLSAFDQAVKDWQDHGGNQIRREFQQAIAASRG